MKKHSLLLATVFLACLLLSSCGASGGTGAPAAPHGDTIPYGGWDGEAMDLGEGPGLSPSAQPQTESGGGVYRNENAKIIRTAQLALQTTDFDHAYQTLDKLVQETGGYYESAETSGGGYYDQGGSRSGSFIIRVPKGQFDPFLDSVGGVGHVISARESSEDIGSAYFDTEAHLKTLRIKQERLQSLLEQAATMEDIISLENALAEVEYEIEQNSSQLRRYDSLVDYATIHLSIDEVYRISEQTGETAGLGARIAAAFTGGMTSFADGLGNFAVWCAYHLIGILFSLAVAVVAAIVLLRVRRAKIRASSSQAPAASNSGETPPEEKK